MPHFSVGFRRIRNVSHGGPMWASAPTAKALKFDEGVWVYEKVSINRIGVYIPGEFDGMWQQGENSVY